MSDSLRATRKKRVTYLLVELDVGGFKELLDVTRAEVVGELVVRQRHALGSFRLSIGG